MLLAPYVCFHIGHLLGNIAAHSAYDMFSWCRYLIVNLVFSHLGFWSGNLFLIAPFPDLCLLVPFLWISAKLGTYHLGLKIYNVFINRDPVMTLTYFMSRSTEVAHAFEWGKFEGQNLQEISKWTDYY